MLSFVRCSLPQQRGRDLARNCICFSLVIIFLFSPSASTAFIGQIGNLLELSMNPSPVPLDALPSTAPTLPSGLLPSLLEEFHADPSNQLNQIIYQDPPASRPQDAEVSHLAKRQQVDAGSTHPQYFPQPFDTSLGTEFESDTCQPFMSKFLNNPGFQDCHPFSLLLTTSQSFFRAYSAMTPANHSNYNPARAASIMSVKQVLDASCSVDVNKCAELLHQLAVSINSSTIGCGKDLEKQNSLPLQALDGLQNYKLMREVACLTTTQGDDGSPRVEDGTTRQGNSTVARGSSNNSTLSNSTLSSSPRYCFEKAVSRDKPDDLYYYYLPSGTSLPSGTQSSCDQCTKSIMNIDASNISLALSKTYQSARTMTNSQCGPGFAPLPINMANRLASSAHRLTSTMPSASALKFATWIFAMTNLLLFRI